MAISYIFRPNPPTKPSPPSPERSPSRSPSRSRSRLVTITLYSNTLHNSSTLLLFRSALEVSHLSEHTRGLPREEHPTSSESSPRTGMRTSGELPAGVLRLLPFPTRGPRLSTLLQGKSIPVIRWYCFLFFSVRNANPPPPPPFLSTFPCFFFFCFMHFRYYNTPRSDWPGLFCLFCCS